MAYHLRLEHAEFLLLEVIEVLKTIVGCVAIWHQSGKTGEHPHLHIWYPLEDNIQSEAFYNRLNKFNPIFKNFVGNKSKSVRPHDDLFKFYQYCMKGPKGQKVVVNNSGNIFPEIIPEIKHENVIVNLATIKTQRKKAMKIQFVDYLRNVEEWKENEYFTTDFTPTQIYSEVANHCVNFWKDAFTIPEGERMVRYAAYIYSTDDVRDILQENTTRNIVKRIVTG